MTALARTADPDTAKAAARTYEAGSLHARILDELLHRAVRGGLTTTELAQALDTPRDSISPRMKDLVKSGLVQDGGGRRVPEGHTRASIIWERTHVARDQVLALLADL